MRYVLDANVALKWVLAEPDSNKAKQLRTDFRSDVHELIAPDIYVVEIAHALTRAERQGRISVGQSGIFWADVMSTSPLLERSGPLTPRAIAISSALRIGVYDCLYVALAQRESCQLVTADDKLVRTFQPIFPFIVALASLP
jgi:predicted nucleic acid-binding protein